MDINNVSPKQCELILFSFSDPPWCNGVYIISGESWKPLPKWEQKTVTKRKIEIMNYLHVYLSIFAYFFILFYSFVCFFRFVFQLKETLSWKWIVSQVCYLLRNHIQVVSQKKKKDDRLLMAQFEIISYVNLIANNSSFLLAASSFP